MTTFLTAHVRSRYKKIHLMYLIQNQHTHTRKINPDNQTSRIVIYLTFNSTFISFPHVIHPSTDLLISTKSVTKSNPDTK